MMNERVYNREIERLRSPERIEKLNVKKVVDIVLKEKKINSILDIGTEVDYLLKNFQKIILMSMVLI